jgi:hypothetical protein
VIFDDIHLLVGFHPYSERFFIGSCFDLRDNPEWTNPPGGGRPSSVTLNVLLTAVGLELRVLDQQTDREDTRILNEGDGSTVGFIGGSGDTALKNRLATSIRFAGDLAGVGSVRNSSGRYPICQSREVVDAADLGFGASRGVVGNLDAGFRLDSHILTSAPSGVGEDLASIITNLRTYPGSAFVLDPKGESYAVTAGARRELGQHVVVIDPFGITGVASHAFNWLDTLDPISPDVVSRAATLSEMIIENKGNQTNAHWIASGRELLRGLLVYVAGLPADRRSMAELRRIIIAPDAEWANTLVDMMSDPYRGYYIPARTAAAHLNRSEPERHSVLSTVIRHTAWLDDPRLRAVLGHSDFSLADLKLRPTTVYLAIPSNDLQICLSFVRGFVGLALDAVIAAPAQPAHPVVFFVDKFDQLGHMDRLRNAVALLRGHGAELWLSDYAQASKSSGDQQSPYRLCKLDNFIVAKWCSQGGNGSGASAWKEHSW